MMLFDRVLTPIILRILRSIRRKTSCAWSFVCLLILRIRVRGSHHSALVCWRNEKIKYIIII